MPAGLKGYSNIAGYVAPDHGVNGLMRHAGQRTRPVEYPGQHRLPGFINTEMLRPPTYAVFRPGLENPSHEDATEPSRTMQVLATDWPEPGALSEEQWIPALDEARFPADAAIPGNPGQISRG